VIYGSADEAAGMKTVVAICISLSLLLVALLSGPLLPTRLSACAAFIAKLEKLGYRVESISADSAGYLVLTYPIPKTVINLNETSFVAGARQFSVRVIYRESDAFYFFDFRESTPDWAVVYAYNLSSD
jgi:hypothetical protein